MNLEHIREALPLIKRVGDTMAVLGFVEPLARVRAQGETLGKLLDIGSDHDGDSLLAVAEAIINIEQDLLRYLAPSTGKKAMTD